MKKLAILALLVAAACRTTPQPAAGPEANPWFPLEPGTGWRFETIHWDYPSRVNGPPVVFSREQTWQILSAQAVPGGFRVLTEPPAGQMLGLEKAGWPDAQLFTDAQGIYLEGGDCGKKKTCRLLLIPLPPEPGQTWIGPGPGDLVLEGKVAARSPRRWAGADLAPDQNVRLEIEYRTAGHTRRLNLTLAHGLGPVEIESLEDQGRGLEPTDRRQRLRPEPFSPPASRGGGINH